MDEIIQAKKDVLLANQNVQYWEDVVKFLEDVKKGQEAVAEEEAKAEADEAAPAAEVEAPEVKGEYDESLSSQIDKASAEVNTNPTEAQKEAGNYKKGHVQVGNFDITIEQPVGSTRRGTDANGNHWETKMNNTYGYFRGTEGVDGDHIDVFLSNNMDGWDGHSVFVVDQYNPDGTFDEHKVMLGFNSAEDARHDYLANYSEGWEDGRRIDVSSVSLEDFEKWMDSSKRKTKPFSEYSSVKMKTDYNASDNGKSFLQEKTEALLNTSRKLTLDEASDIFKRMKTNAQSVPNLKATDENWQTHVDTPIGTIKMGDHQLIKLDERKRLEQYGMTLDTLSNPHIILIEEDKEFDPNHERPFSILFIKTYKKGDGKDEKNLLHFESITVSQEKGTLEVSISSHILRTNQLKKKLKSDRLLYKATALNESANSFAEQPANKGGGPSSTDKVTESAAPAQTEGKENDAKDGVHYYWSEGYFDSLTDEQKRKFDDLAESLGGHIDWENNSLTMPSEEAAEKMFDAVDKERDATTDSHSTEKHSERAEDAAGDALAESEVKPSDEGQTDEAEAKPKQPVDPDANLRADIREARDMAKMMFPDANPELLDKIARDLNQQPLTREQRSQMERIAKAFGLRIRWFKTMPQNGTYSKENGVICIATDSWHQLSDTFGHEMTHALKDVDMDAYNRLKQAVIEANARNEEERKGLQMKVDEKYSHYKAKDRWEEFVSDEIGAAIASRDMADKILFNLDHKVLGRMRDIVKKMMAAVSDFEFNTENKVRNLLRMDERVRDERVPSALDKLQGAIMDAYRMAQKTELARRAEEKRKAEEEKKKEEERKKDEENGGVKRSERTVDNENKSTMRERVQEWLSKENLEWAEGKSREEILEHFGNEMQPIAIVPIGYLKYLGDGFKNNAAYCGMGYMIDHAVNHHSEEPIENYNRIQEILDYPNEVKLDNRKERTSLIFIKKYDNYLSETISLDSNDNGRVVIHKTLNHKSKMPHKALPSVAIESPSEDGISSISHSSNEEPARSDFSALDGQGKDTDFSNNPQTSAGENEGRGTKFSLRTKPAPKNTQKVYKLMRLGEDGKLYPLFVDAAEPINMGKWYDADSPGLDMLKKMPSGLYLVDIKNGTSVTAAEFTKEHPEIKVGKKLPYKDAVNYATNNGLRWMYIEDTKLGQKRFGGERRRYWNIGIGGSGAVNTFSMRPGWHAGSLPVMLQIGKGKDGHLRDDRFVWVEGEVPADIDYNEEAQRNPDKDIPDHIPEDGFYMKATNADKVKSQADLMGWYVAGSFKANRVISDAEARSIIDKFNEEHGLTEEHHVAYDYEREGGVPFSEEDAKRVNGQNGTKEQKRTPTSSELALRDGLVERLREAGLGVSLSEEEGQRVLDLVNGGAREHKVYHGSHADFDHFDHSHMGEGEGVQAYGWGSYVTEVEGIGRSYAKQNTRLNSPILQKYAQKKHRLSLDEQKRDYLIKESMPRYDRIIKEKSEMITDPQYAEDKDFYEMMIEKAKQNKVFTQKLIDDLSRRIDENRDWLEKHPYDEPTKHLYTVEIPDDTGNNYLNWDGSLTDEQIKRILKGLRDIADIDTNEWNADGLKGEARYAYLVAIPEALGFDVDEDDDYEIMKATSEFLSEIGFTGIKYPANYRRGGRKDGAKNYVIFNDEDLEITDHVRFFRGKGGEAYGFTVDGKIYIDPKHVNAETPIHEYAHLWATALQQKDAKAWGDVVRLMKDTGIWESVREAYPELKTDDEIADEVLATYSGQRGAERLREEMRQVMQGEGRMVDKVDALSAMERVRNAIARFWRKVAEMLGIRYRSAEDVADHVLGDLLERVNPNVGVRTDAKAREMSFGEPYDYERYPLGHVEPNLNNAKVKIVDTTNNDHGFANYNDAKDWAKENLCKVYSNEETGGKGEFEIVPKVINKYVSKVARDKSENEHYHYVVMRNLPSLLRDSIEVETHPNFLSHGAKKVEGDTRYDKNSLIHILYGAARIDGKICRVKITAKEYPNNSPSRPYSFEVTSIDTNIESSMPIDDEAQRLGRDINDSISAANLLKDVEMSYDPGKKLLDESEDLTNESPRQASSTQSGVRESRRVSGRLANTGNTSSVAQRIYEEAVRGRAFEIDEAWHDSLVSVKALQDALAKERGVDIRDLENVYLHLVHLSSVSAAEMTEYRNEQVENLLDARGKNCAYIRHTP